MWDLLSLSFITDEETGTPLRGMPLSQGHTAEEWQGGIKIQNSSLSKVKEGQASN